jgi:hypothetical protein
MDGVAVALDVMDVELLLALASSTGSGRYGVDPAEGSGGMFSMLTFVLFNEKLFLCPRLPFSERLEGDEGLDVTETSFDDAVRTSDDALNESDKLCLSVSPWGLGDFDGDCGRVRSDLTGGVCFEGLFRDEPFDGEAGVDDAEGGGSFSRPSSPRSSPALRFNALLPFPFRCFVNALISSPLNRSKSLLPSASTAIISARSSVAVFALYASSERAVS